MNERRKWSKKWTIFPHTNLDQLESISELRQCQTKFSRQYQPIQLEASFNSGREQFVYQVNSTDKKSWWQKLVDIYRGKYLELWKILTLVTVIMSVTSLWFWFNDFEPKLKDQTFLWIDRVKTKLFSQYQVISDYNFVRSNFLTTKITLTGPCYQQIQKVKLNFSQSDLFFEQISRFEKEFTYLRVQAQSSNYNSELIEVSELKEVFNQFDQYLGLARARATDYIQGLNQGLLFKQLASEFCLTKDMEVQNKILSVLESVWQILKKNPSLNQSWLKNSRKWLDICKKLLDSNWQTTEDLQALESLLGEFADSFRQLFESDAEFRNWDRQTLLTKSTNPEENFLRSVQKLQNWQQEYLNKRPNLKSQVVIIQLHLKN